MSVYAHVDGLGQLIDQLTADSVIAWRKEFKPGYKTVDTFAEHLIDIQIDVNIRPAGVAMLTVRVNGNGFLEASVECFRLKRSRLGNWTVSASSLKRK